ncbi:MAG: hypothetical protein WBY94_13010 [Polyangiaceae bacterium]
MRVLPSPRASASRFATTVFDRERALVDETPVATGKRIAKALHDRTGKVVGSGGFDVLFARSLVLARRRYPNLSSVRAEPGGELSDSAEQSDAAAMQPAIVAVFATFVELMCVLIGEDLALRLAGDAWPQTSSIAFWPR